VIPVLAHGVSGRYDLPLPLWLFVYGAAVIVVIVFIALRVSWPRPRFTALGSGRPVPASATRAGSIVHVAMRALGLFTFAIVLIAAVWGVDDAAANIAPYALYIVFWVGFMVACGLIGDVYESVNPFDTLAALLRLPDRTARRDPGQWPAAVLLFSFVWLELAYYEPSSPRVIGRWLALYTLAVLVGAALWGRRWLRAGEGFAALFALFGSLAPVGRDQETGRLRLRCPLTGLASVPVMRGTAAVVIISLGSTTFDGVARTRTWASLVGNASGWSLTGIKTLGLMWVITVVAMLYLGAIRGVARITDRDASELGEQFLPVVIPIAFAYAFAHYFSLLVLDGQNVIALVSDPFGKGWDLFGTFAYTVNYKLLTLREIALVQVTAVLIGHCSGVVTALDKSLELFKRRMAVRAVYPLVAVIVASTAGALLLLLGG
jgi:hypothetical protein